MNRSDFNQLGQFVTHACKRFPLHRLAGGLGDARPQPQIPTRAVGLSLVLGEVVQVPGFLPLQQETALPQCQRWMGHASPISHDTFGCVTERRDPAQ
jgi:hypothetical protein